jgi:hypothetical protein
MIGVSAQNPGSSIHIGGDVTSGAGGIGAAAADSGTVTVEGEISAATYIRIGTADKAQGEHTGIDGGYHVYTDAASPGSSVLVKLAAADTTPPTVAAYSPADDATGVAIDTDLVLTFSEDIVAVAGYVYLNRTAPPWPLLFTIPR